MIKLNKNEEKLKSFIKYCKQHPEERFWQSLRNWSKKEFILTADCLRIEKGKTIYDNLKDTFYED